METGSSALFQIYSRALHTGLSLVGHAHAVAGVEAAGAEEVVVVVWLTGRTQRGQEFIGVHLPRAARQKL